MTSRTLTCPECEEGSLVLGVRDIQFMYQEQPVLVTGLECFRCELCATETVKTDQIRRNEVKIADAKRRAAGLLTGDEIRQIRVSLKLSQPEAAQLFGGGTNGFSKYERGQTVQSVPMDRLLRAAATFPGMVDFLRWQAGIATKVTLTSAYVVDIGAVSLNDPLYTSKPIRGLEVIVSSQHRESKVVSITERLRKKIA